MNQVNENPLEIRLRNWDAAQDNMGKSFANIDQIPIQQSFRCENKEGKSQHLFVQTGNNIKKQHQSRNLNESQLRREKLVRHNLDKNPLKFIFNKYEDVLKETYQKANVQMKELMEAYDVYVPICVEEELDKEIDKMQKVVRKEVKKKKTEYCPTNIPELFDERPTI